MTFFSFHSLCFIPSRLPLTAVNSSRQFQRKCNEMFKCSRYLNSFCILCLSISEAKQSSEWHDALSLLRISEFLYDSFTIRSLFWGYATFMMSRRKDNVRLLDLELYATTNLLFFLSFSFQAPHASSKTPVILTPPAFMIHPDVHRSTWAARTYASIFKTPFSRCWPKWLVYNINFSYEIRTFHESVKRKLPETMKNRILHLLCIILCIRCWLC